MSTQLTESPPGEPQEVVTESFGGSPKHEPLVPAHPRLKEPRGDSLVYPHLNQHFDPPPSDLPKKKRKGFKSKFLGLFVSFGL